MGASTDSVTRLDYLPLCKVATKIISLFWRKYSKRDTFNINIMLQTNSINLQTVLKFIWQMIFV